ncbi:hypothetical protein ABWH91_04300 [Phycisphaerales bacterium ac7]
MKINADKFKKAIKDSGIDVETLAAALPRSNDGQKQQRLALKKVRNWMSGKDHPSAKAEEVDALAGASASRRCPLPASRAPSASLARASASRCWWSR